MSELSNLKPGVSKIILCIFSLRNGGAERVMVNLANFLVKEGHDVDILTVGKADTGYRLSPKIRIIELGLDDRNTGSMSALKNLGKRIYSIFKVFDQKKPSLCISFMTETNLMTLIAGRFASIPVIISERTNPTMHRVSFIYRILRKVLYRYAKVVVLQTQGIRDFYKDNFRLSNLCVIPNPIDLSDFPPVEKQLGKSIVSIGRLSKEKGHQMLIDAYASSTAVKFGWTLKIVGSGPLQSALMEQVQNLGINNWVKFEGRSLDVYSHLRTAGIFILPSIYEGFPNALMEALSTGTPSISTNCKYGPSDLIDHGKNGFLCENLVDLTNYIDILIHDEKIRDSFRRQGPESMKKFDCKEVMEKWRLLINEIL